MHSHFSKLRGLDQTAGEIGRNRLRHRHMRHAAITKKARFTPVGAIHKLIDQNKQPGMKRLPE